MHNKPPPHRLTPWSSCPLSLGQVRPSGWLLDELRCCAAGIAGHEHDFYPYVHNSRWLHPQGSGRGEDYSTLNEALPYWLNGLVPLAYTLDDPRLKHQVHSVADTVLDLAEATDDGWLGPEPPGGSRNFWGRTPLIMGLEQLAEADPAYRPRVISVLRRYFRLMNAMLHRHGSGHVDGPDASWGQARVFDSVMTIHWLLEHDNEADGVEIGRLWETMALLDEYTTVRWDVWYSSKDYPKVVLDPREGSPLFPFLHGVNVAQGLKSSAVALRCKPSTDAHAQSARAVDLTFGHHGAPSGTVLADELLTSRAPYAGSELCMHVETAFSMTYMAHSLGVGSYADHAEQVMYNAYPAAFTDDYWAHQYMTQPNQPWAKKLDEAHGGAGAAELFTTAHSGVATTFGLEPQYPCCTVNLPQAWPKFIAWSWGIMDSGLAHVLLCPSKVSATIGGTDVTVECETMYPFDHTLRYKTSSTRALDLFIRIPTWAGEDSTIQSASSPALTLHPDNATRLHRVSLPPGENTLTLVLTAATRVLPRSNGAISVYHGPLLYALEIESETETFLSHSFDDPDGPGKEYAGFPQLRDYHLSGTTAWNIAIDPSTLKYHAAEGDAPGQRTTGTSMFAQGRPADHMTVMGCEVDWPLHLDCTPDWPPEGPRKRGDAKEYRLIPYGSAKLHMSELPVIKL